MAIDPNNVCTDDDLAARAGRKRLEQAQPDITERNAARATAVREIVLALQGRTPPIRESDLTDVTEMRDVAVARALQIIFEKSMTSVDSLHGQLAAQFGREYVGAAKRSYTVSGGARGPSGSSYRMERR